MPRYQHYSFDLWLTLIRSNPAFKPERAQHFHRYFNFKRKPLEEIVKVFRQVDTMCNSINERTGGNITAEEMYLMVISQINDHSIDLKEIDVTALYQAMEDLLMAYPPMMYCDDTLGVLHQLKRERATITLLSNTGFIKGPTLRKVLRGLGLDACLDHQFYSDEEGMSKPNQVFYQRMIDQAMSYHGRNMQLNRIVHVGDNPYADIAGANATGIHSLQINSNELTIKTLLN